MHIKNHKIFEIINYVVDQNKNFEWDENKNKINIDVHGIDFQDGYQVFENPMLRQMDNRKEYGESRWIGLGKLFEAVVVIILTEHNQKIRIISIRRANRHEREIYKTQFEKPH